ncbi:MAG: hypothetical protein OSB00_06070 [Sphingomonas bacterium]|nr:hypothetical protein [Sphingomonas bacterium]
MATSSPTPPAGGSLIALGAVGGTTIGFILQQVTSGFLIGTGAGIAAALTIWWRHRTR